MDDKSPIVDRQAKKQMLAVSQRIRARAEELGVNQAELTRKTGMAKQLTGKYWHGQSAVAADKLFDIADALGVSARWLLTGEGSQNPPIEAGELERLGELSSDEGSLVADYRRLPDSNRIVLKAVLDSMLGRLIDTSHPLMRKGDPSISAATLHASETAFRGEGDE